ncbi:MAG: hypothetical protein JOS17DRAFT_794058 [Linnemannia elongata]|nr:MAG: hypothetical protein JOS17DRAFT_794058 [Linnemannia elongata]
MPVSPTPYQPDSQAQTLFRPSTRPLSPLDIPELLELIFSFINGHTLRISVLVCRQWYRLNQDRLFRELIWDVSWSPSEPKQALKQLPGAGRLVLSCSEVIPEWRGPDLHRALLALQKPARQWTTLSPLAWYRNTATATKPTDNYSRLRELVLTTGLNFGDTAVDLLPFPPSLTSLTIHQDILVSLDIGRILVICPLLRTLRLSSRVVMVFRGPYTSQGKGALQDPLPLRSLVLQHTAVRQSWMEDLLSITPHLQELQLINIKGYNGAPWHGPRFRTYLQRLSLSNLRQFHFSQHKSSIDEPDQAEMTFAICPLTKERSFLCSDLTPEIVGSLTGQSILLTSLEILLPYDVYCYGNGWARDNSDHGYLYTARLLHKLLCENPNLRHLRTLKIPYMTYWMDIHHRLGHFSPAEGYSTSYCTVRAVPGIWICRGLEKLDLDLHIHEHGRVRGDQHMRIAYGYIARVCPHLQDLRISFPIYCHFSLGYKTWDYKPFVLSGGMSLLSRLVRLERLRIEYMTGTVACELAELNWLCRSGRAEEHRARRRAIVEDWKESCKREGDWESLHLWKDAGVPMDILGSGRDDVELMKSLKNQGLLQDVVDVVKEMDTDEFDCLPELRQLACGRHLEQTPEKEMRSIFHSGPSGLIGGWLSSWGLL